jgi:hypothetical protein
VHVLRQEAIASLAGRGLRLRRSAVPRQDHTRAHQPR